MRIVHSKLYRKESKKKVEKEINSIIKESSMTQKEFDEIKGIALEMKDSGKIELLVATLIVVIGPLEGVIVAQPCVKAPVTPVQLVKTRSEST